MSNQMTDVSDAGMLEMLNIVSSPMTLLQETATSRLRDLLSATRSRIDGGDLTVDEARTRLDGVYFQIRARVNHLGTILQIATPVDEIRATVAALDSSDLRAIRDHARAILGLVSGRHPDLELRARALIEIVNHLNRWLPEVTKWASQSEATDTDTDALEVPW